MLGARRLACRTPSFPFRAFSTVPSLGSVKNFIAENGGMVTLSAVGASGMEKPPGGWKTFIEGHPEWFVLGKESTVFTVRLRPPKAKATENQPEPTSLDGLLTTLQQSFKNALQIETKPTRLIALDVGEGGMLHLYRDGEHVSFDCYQLEASDVRQTLSPLLDSDTTTTLLPDTGTIENIANLLYPESPLSINKPIDMQILGEAVFGKPFLTRGELSKELDAIDVGHTASALGHHKDQLFPKALAFCESNLSRDDLNSLIQASRQRSQARDENSICFDQSAQYRMYSTFLFGKAQKEPTTVIAASPHLERVDFPSVCEVLPASLQTRLNGISCEDITEIVLDLGRRPYFLSRNPSSKRYFYEDASIAVLPQDVEHVIQRVGKIGSDNRAGLPKQLHRFSVLRDRQRNIFGVTIRVGKHVEGIVNIILDILMGSNSSVLVLGEPGSGKTTIIREITRRLSETSNVIVVDTSNEIAGDGIIPHESIGNARRMMVEHLDKQGAVMIECVQNHTPHVMVVDEIGRKPEVEAARTVKNRGVRMIASAHGNLHGLVENRQLAGLVGGVEQVTLGDEMARRMAVSQSHGTSGAPRLDKIYSQRASLPTFEVIIEVCREAIHDWRVVTDTASAVDAILMGNPYKAEIRSQDPETGRMSMYRVVVPRDEAESEKKRIAVKTERFSLGQNDDARTKDVAPIEESDDSFPDKVSEGMPPELTETTFQLTDGTSCQVVPTAAALQQILQTDSSFDLSASVGPHRFVAMDCEGVPENLHLVQLATPQGVYIVDCVMIGSLSVCQALQPVLSSPHIVKVLHDLRCDVQALYRHGDISRVAGVLDTQLVADYLWCHDIRYHSTSLGLNAFLERVGVPLHPSKTLVKEMSEDAWKKRPLARNQLEYAAWDVRLLLQAIQALHLSDLDLNKCLQQSQRRADDAIAMECFGW